MARPTGITSRTAQLTPSSPYSALFSLTDRAESLMMATGRLMICLNHPANEFQTAIWCENLSQYTPEQLTRGFVLAEKTLKAFPSVAALHELISEPIWREELAFVLQNLKIHGATWQDMPDSTKPVAVVDETKYRVEWVSVAGKRAPDIPPCALEAILAIGSGDLTLGLEFLEQHPSQWPPSAVESTPNHRLSAQRQVEDRFKAAWMAVRG